MGSMTSGYTLEGVADYTGDHTTDLLWRNDTTGDVKMWAVNNGTPTQLNVSGSGTDYKIVA
jgi:hypothetical protein